MTSRSDGNSPWQPDPMSMSSLTRSLEIVMHANATAAGIWLESWAKLASETIDFVQRRWARDSELLQGACRCSSPLDLVRLQTGFLQRAMFDYVSETARVADMETESGVCEIQAVDRGVRQACEPVRHGELV